jgi:hypothetical protein
MPSFTYSTKSKRYHDTTTGRYVGRVEVRKELDSIIDQSSAEMQYWTLNLRNGYSSIAEWQTLMAGEIKNLQIVMSVAANGGWEQMDPEDYSRLEGYIAEQYQYLQGFAEDIYTGKQLPNGSMAVRASLYAEASRQTYENERRILETEAGSTQELNILGGADHCIDCTDMTGEGWVPIGTLIPIGLRICQARCHCTIIYRVGPDDKLGSEIETF